MHAAPARWRQPRVWYIGLALITIAVGLSVHGSTPILTTSVRDKLGDALWAAMTAWWIGAVIPNAPLRVRILLALAVCFAVETSQLIHIEALDSLRRTALGHLFLGSGFDLRDLLAYTLGVLATGLLEAAVRCCSALTEQ
jgi:hypothetical protein